VPRYFFVIGTPRSGTTLLQAMLMRATGVYIPPETKFLEITWYDRFYVGSLDTDAGWHRAVAAVLRIVDSAEIPVDREQLQSSLAAAPRTHRGLFQGLLDAVALHTGADVIGEKSPVHTRYARELLRLFPESRVVQILRDPRDVAVSQREAFGATPLQSALRWRRDAVKHAEYERDLEPSAYLAIRYEDLVRRPEATLESVCTFLGIAYRPEILEPHLRPEIGFASSETHKRRTLEPLTTSRIGRYRERLARRDRAVVEWWCGAHMARHDYDAESLPGWLGLVTSVVQLPTLAALHVRRHAGLLLRRLSRGER
jgi:hypothetical protein